MAVPDGHARSSDRALGALELLARAGRPGVELATRLDLVRSLGIRVAWRRQRDELRQARLSGGGMRPGYRDLWTAAAREVGADAVELGGGFLELRKGDRRTRVWHAWTTLDDAVTVRLAEDKRLAHRLLAAADLPIAAHVFFERRDPSPAFEFLAAQNGPCVLKPIDTAGGSGATTSIRSRDQLRRACLRAGRLSGRLMLETQISGDLYRLLLLDGEPIGCIRRLPPRVTGTGAATIADLIAAENRRRTAAAAGERTSLLMVDLDCVFTLEDSGQTLRSLPTAGERVPVKTVVNQNCAEDNETVGDELAPALIAEAAKAAETIGVKLAGVDLITTDPTRSLADSGGAIVEVNATPGLHYHYEVADRATAVPVAVPIVRRLLD